MNTIWKVVLQVVDYQEIEMHVGSKILHLDDQHNVPCLWIMVNESISSEIRKFRIYGTGHDIDMTNLEYIGTFQLRNQLFVGHLFEIIN